MSAGLSEASARQYVLRVKSLLGYAQKLGYTQFNAGATIKVRSDASNRGATLAKRGLRVSETVGLTWADVLPRDNRVQLSILGKGGKVRQVLLPEIVSRALLSLRGEAGAKPACHGEKLALMANKTHRVIIEPTTTIRSERGQRYRVYYQDAVLIDETWNPEFEAGRALVACGVTGRLEVWRADQSYPGLIFPIEEGARWTVVENDKIGPVIRPWQPFPEHVDPDAVFRDTALAPAAISPEGVV